MEASGRQELIAKVDMGNCFNEFSSMNSERETIDERGFDSVSSCLLPSIVPLGFHPKSPRRLARPRTSPFHGGNTGSNPVGDANKTRATRKLAKILNNRVVRRCKVAQILGIGQ